jgi:hypothetical protein
MVPVGITARRVHCNRGRPKAAGKLLDCLFHSDRRADVSSQRHGLSTRIPNLLSNADTRGLIAVKNPYCRSFVGQAESDSPTDSMTCAGHDCYSSVELHHDALPSYLVPGACLTIADRSDFNDRQTIIGFHGRFCND